MLFGPYVLYSLRYASFLHIDSLSSTSSGASTGPEQSDESVFTGWIAYQLVMGDTPIGKHLVGVAILFNLS